MGLRFRRFVFFVSAVFFVNAVFFASASVYTAYIHTIYVYTTHPHELCQGFVPENDLYIPVDDYQNLSMDQAVFDAVLDRIEKVYTPIVAEHRGNLVVSRQWSNGRVNASASRSGSTYFITMFGGLARHEAITPDGLMLVACHEIGHHIGGSPKYSGWTTWASNEGQSDYFATLRCMRLVYTDEENQEWVDSEYVDPFVVSECERVWSESISDQNACMRSAMAGLSVATMFQMMRNEEEPARFDSPDPSTVDNTFASHPGTQCRLDTYFQAALCDIQSEERFNDRDYRVGTCTENSGHLEGLRPRCWFSPGRNGRPRMSQEDLAPDWATF